MSTCLYARDYKLKSMQGPHLDVKNLRGPQFKACRALPAVVLEKIPQIVQILTLLNLER